MKMKMKFPTPRWQQLLLILISEAGLVLGRGYTHDPELEPLSPLAINTWGGPFTAATDAAYLYLVDPAGHADGHEHEHEQASALTAVQLGCAACERRQCDGTVGFGGSPDEACETTLDALVMDGTTLRSGAVASLRRVRHAVAVARAVMDHTHHSLLAGDLATRFAVENGFTEEGEGGGGEEGEGLSTPESRAMCAAWKEKGCSPNYRRNVRPREPGTRCGPYEPEPPAMREGDTRLHQQTPASHDTISMVVIDQAGRMAAATSTNGALHKVPGRVGDGAIVGSGAYVDGEVGGCGATGDGDVMMRFLPCYQAVENLRRGMGPRQAAEDAVARMVRRYPALRSGLVVVDNKGAHAGAGSGWTFTYSFRGGLMNATTVVEVPPVEARGRALQRLEDEL